MRNKTIIYAGGFELPDKNAAANRVVSNGKIFNSLGYKTVFAGTSYADEHFEGLRAVGENMYESSRPKSSLEWIKRMFSIKDIEALIKADGDVGAVILYNMPFLTLMKAKIVLKKQGIKVCYDCTEWTAFTDGSFLKRVYKAFDEILVRNFAHFVADKIIVISSLMAEKYKKNKSLVIIPPLVDINDPVWHQKVTDKEPGFEFCFAGVPDGNKERLDTIVRAFYSIDANARLRIIGITEEDFQKIYPDFHLKKSEDKELIFMGRLSHSDALKYVKNCDCYIFIRNSDRRNNAGFPTKFAEAFTCGVPIITTNVSDVGSYLENGCLLNEVSEEGVGKAMLSQLAKSNLKQKAQLNRAFHFESYKDKIINWLG